MSLIALKTSAGNYLHSDAGTDAPRFLKLIQLADDQVMLQVPESGHYLMVGPDGLSTSADAGPHCRLRLSAQDDGAVALLAPDGVHYLSTASETVAASSTAIGEHERFYLETHSESPQGCCGARPGDSEPGVLWEKHAHKRVVERAGDLLVGLRALPEVARFLDTYWANATFRVYVFKGLEEADTKSPWKDNNWESHFHNPDTYQNYRLRLEKTALSEGRRYFGLSEHMGQRIFQMKNEPNGPGETLFKHAGYYLGLSLHFLTDLTQPMHAANFVNVWGWEGGIVPNIYDRRHAGFEVLADDAVRHYKYLELLDPLTPHDVRLFSDPGFYLDEVARESKANFERYLRPALQKKENFSHEGVPLPLYRENYWNLDEAVPILNGSLRLAPARVARYLVNWSRRVATGLNLNSDTWYSILEPTRAPANPEDLDKYEVAGMVNSGEVIRYAWQDWNWTQQWFLHFNDDGTVCIGSREWKNSVWVIYEKDNNWWVGHWKDAAERRTRFRIIAGDPNRYWILEPTLNDAVTVKSEGDHQGVFWRKDPHAPHQQFFRLRALNSTITGDERTEIRKTFPTFGDRKWWGVRDTVPEWERGVGD